MQRVNELAFEVIYSHWQE